MHLLKYNLNKVKSNFDFLFLVNVEAYGEINFLELPFYFDKNEKYPRYYRFGSYVTNYSKLQNVASPYLVFSVHSAFSVRVRSDVLFDLDPYLFSNLFRSKKYFGHLLENTYDYSRNLYVGDSYLSNIENYSRRDYFIVSDLPLLFYKRKQLPLLIADSSFYFSLLYHRFHKKWQSSSYDIDSFISRYIFDVRKIYYSGFWDVCDKFFLVNTSKPTSSFFVNGDNVKSDIKYFSYFFFSNFIKKITLKLKFLDMHNWMRNKNFNYGYFFLVNSIFNKLDNIYFSFFDRWIFLNFLYKFLGSFGFLKHISFFIDKELLLLINRIFIFWFFIYIMVKLNDNRGFNLLSLRYFFIILVNLFFNRISESLVILGGFKINHKLSTEMRFLKKGDLSKRVYINKSFLKISFKKHALLLDENNNFITEPLVERNYIYPKWFSSDSYYFGHDDFKTKNVLFLFKNLFVFFFRKKFIVIKSNFLGSLILFRFFISNLFLKNSFFQLKHKFWWSYSSLREGYLKKLLFFYRKEIRKKKKARSFDYALKYFNFLKGRLLKQLSESLYLTRSKYSNLIIKKKLFILGFLDLKINSSFLYYKVESKSALMPFTKKAFVFSIIYYLSYMNFSSSYIYYFSPSMRFFKKNIKLPFVSLRRYRTGIDSNYIISNLDSFDELFLTDILYELITSVSFFGKWKDTLSLFDTVSFISSCYVFFFFCYFYLLDSYALTFLVESLFKLDGVGFFSIYWTDLRLFILIGLIINVKINLNCSLKSFFNLKKKFIQKYSNFKLKVDFIVYMFLGMYVEHFRIFKYNEYIMSNVSLVIGYGASRMLMRRYPSWQRWLDRVYIKSILISGIYNIYKVRGFLNNWYSYDRDLAIDSYIVSPIVSFLKTLYIWRRILWFFAYFFQANFVIFLLIYTFKALFNISYFYSFQKGPMDSIDNLFIGLNFPKKWDWGLAMAGVIYLMMNKLKFYFLKGLSTWNLFLCDQLLCEFLSESKITKFDVAANFFYQLSQLLILDYIDHAFFNDYFMIQGWRILRFIDYIIYSVTMGFMSFVEIRDRYKASSVFVFIKQFKVTLDFLLWDIDNFFRFFDYSYLIYNINLLLNKFEFDKKTLLLEGTINFFHFFFFSTTSITGKITFINEDLIENGTNIQLILFFSYLFIRDLYLNVVCSFFWVFIFYNNHIMSYLKWVCFDIQFNFVSDALGTFLYYSIFLKAALDLENDLDFKYYDYVL